MRSRTKVKNEWSYTSTTPHALVACTKATFAFYLEKLMTYKGEKKSIFNPLALEMEI